MSTTMTTESNPALGTQAQWEDLLFLHKKGGNGWVIVQEVDDRYVRVALIGKDEIDNRAYLAARDMLIPNGTLTPQQLDRANALREKLASGELRVVQTHIK